MERGTYPTLWQWNGKVYLTHVCHGKRYLPHPVAGMERGTYPTLWQWNGKRYLPHPVAVEWKEVLTPPCGSKWKEVLTPPCGSGMERCT